MSIFKKPEEREPKKTLSMLIYGMPSCGKTTLACSAPNPVLMDFENGLDRVNYAHRIPSFTPSTWEDVNTAINELRNSPEIQTVIVDSIDRLMDTAMEYVRVTYPKLIQRDGTPSMKAYGTRKVLYQQFVQQMRNMGKNVIYVAHVVEDKRKVGAEEVIFYRPNISKSNAPDITTDLDMEGFMFADGGNRYITFDPWGDIECKNSCDLHGKWDDACKMYNPMPIPMIIDAAGNATAANDYLTRFFNWNAKRVQDNFNKMRNAAQPAPQQAPAAAPAAQAPQPQHAQPEAPAPAAAPAPAHSTKSTTKGGK